VLKEVSMEQAVDRINSLFSYAKKDLGAIINCIKKDVFAKKPTKKREEKIEKEYTAGLMMMTEEICQKKFNEEICRKIREELWKRIYSCYFDTSKPLLSSMLAFYELVFDEPIPGIDDEEISKIPIRLSFIDRRNLKYAAFKIDISRQRKQSSKKNAISN